jgi:hypothetical protein
MRAEKIEVGESSLERRVVLQDQHVPGTDPSDREKLGNGDQVMMGIVNGMRDDVLVCTKDGYFMERNWTKCSQVAALEVKVSASSHALSVTERSLTMSSNLRFGNFLLSCATRLTLPVPTTLPSGRSSSFLYSSPSLPTNASLGSSLSSMHAISHPSFNVVGTSLSAWTIMSIPPVIRLASSSSVHNDLAGWLGEYAARRCRGVVWLRSPTVDIDLMGKSYVGEG